MQNFPGITQIQGIMICLCLLAQVEQDAQRWELAPLCARQGSLAVLSHPPCLGELGSLGPVPWVLCCECWLRRAGCGHWPCSTGYAATGPSVPLLPAVPTLVAARRWVLGFSLLLEKAPGLAETEHVRGLVVFYKRFV